MNNLAFPVNIKTVKMQDDTWEIYYPALTCLENKKIMQQLNEALYQDMRHLILEQFKEQDAKDFAQMIGHYELKTNERNLISLTQSNYAIRPQAANGLTLMKACTANIKTGEVFQLKDLFKKSSNYVEVLSNHIRKQMKKRGIPSLDNAVTIEKNQDFYVADKCLIIFFQELEITPHYVGIPVFPISVFELEDIINESCPLATMLPS